jgi:hypothetical protein
MPGTPERRTEGSGVSHLACAGAGTERGLAQIDGYLAGRGLDHGVLVLFDQRKGNRTAAERTRREQASSPAGRTITVLRG